MSSVIIRKYKSNDAVGINAMFTKYLPYVRDEQFWVWLNRLIGGESIAFVAEYEGQIIGHYAIIPRDMYVNGQLIKAALSVNAFVDPDYRNKVFIFQITQKLYEYSKEHGIQLIYGFPNVNYRNIQLKIEKWKQVDIFKSFEYDLRDTTPFQSIGVSSDKIDGVDFISLYNISQMEDAESGVKLLSDARYWLERYILHPQKLYEVYALNKDKQHIGYFVTKVYSNNGTSYFHLIDYKLASDCFYDVLLNEFERIGRAKQMDVLSVWQGDSKFRNAIDTIGFKQTGFDTFLGFKVLDDSLQDIDSILNINNWRLVMGDSDAF